MVFFAFWKSSDFSQGFMAAWLVDELDLWIEIVLEVLRLNIRALERMHKAKSKLL